MEARQAASSSEARATGSTAIQAGIEARVGPTPTQVGSPSESSKVRDLHSMDECALVGSLTELFTEGNWATRIE